MFFFLNVDIICICQVLKDDDKREIYDQVIVISLFTETKIVMLLDSHIETDYLYIVNTEPSWPACAFLC
jgi:hypothetical protein